MDRRHFCRRALHLLPLILLLQIPTVSTFPLAAAGPSTGETPSAGQPPEIRAAPPLLWPSVNGIDYTEVLPPTTSSSDNWQPTAYEISDGQVQAPYTLSTEEVAVTSSGTIFLSSSTVTEYDSNSPPPGVVLTPPISSTTPDSGPILSSRGDGGALISTSTTTVIVYASPAARSSIPLPEASSAIPPWTTSTTTSAPIESPTPSFTTSIPESALTSLTTSEVQTVTAAPPADTSGAIQTTLETSGNPSTQPFQTVSVNSSASLSLVDTSTLGSIGPTATSQVTTISAGDIFQPIATDAPPAQISSRSDHPVPRLGIQPQQSRLETNKFYANFFLGDRTAATWTHPYSLTWSKGTGQSSSWGLAVAHIERTQLATGAKTSSDAGEWGFFANPIGIQSLVLSATELGAGTTLTTDSLEAFSVNVNLVAAGGITPTITFPLLQGIGFVTGQYTSGTPLIQSGVGIQNLTYAGGVINNGTTYKYRALLADGFTWLVFVTPNDLNYQENSFTLVSPVSIQGPSGFSGYIQVAKVPASTPDAEAVYDGSAGVYATAASISGAVDGTAGTYTFTWTTQGATSQPLLMFALPHHIESFAAATSAGVTDAQLITTTKGIGTAVRGDSWTLTEPDLPVSMSFGPWTPAQGDIKNLSPAAIQAINAAGATELAQNVSKQTNIGSMYYDGKALAKFAAIVYVLHDMAGNTTLALTGLVELEQAFALHVNNQQTFPLVYDTAWGGAVSSATYTTGNSGEDFGNTFYNDHHFHYGYFVYAAAVIGYIDPAWLTQGTNKAWVNMLVRDYANSITDDPYYPFSRSFDWYMGHSWAEGLFESADGKNEESSSEDTMASYAIKMWGKIINDVNMEARGNLMLALQARSLQNYFLYLDNNAVEPAQFIGNKVSGILFENKIDHTTYFGNNIEYIEGIHMLPLMPMSTLIRTPTFVQQEWAAYNFESYVGSVQGGWRGVLMANLAIIDPVTSYNFFSNVSGNFDYGLLDGGASQTWYLAWSAALGGIP